MKKLLITLCFVPMANVAQADVNWMTPFVLLFTSNDWQSSQAFFSTTSFKNPNMEINGLNYNWPGSLVAGNCLQVDGSGNLSWATCGSGGGGGGGGGFTFDGKNHVAFSTITIPGVGVLTGANNVSTFTLTASTLTWTASLTLSSTTIISTFTTVGFVQFISSTTFFREFTSTNGFIVGDSTATAIGFPNGAVTRTPIFFGGNRRTGVYGTGTDSFAFASNGNQMASVNTANFQVPAGTEGNNSFSIGTNANGFWSTASNTQPVLVTNNKSRQTWFLTGQIILGNMKGPSGSVADVVVTTTNANAAIFSVTSDTVKFQVAGTTWAFESSSGNIAGQWYIFPSTSHNVAKTDLILHLNPQTSSFYFGGDDVGTASGGSGGASSLAVGTGSIQAVNIVSSPTAIVNFDSGTFNTKLTGTATSYVSLVYSSVTVEGFTLLKKSDFDVMNTTHSSRLQAVQVSTGQLWDSVNSTYTAFQVHRTTADTSMVAVNTVFSSMSSLYTSVNSSITVQYTAINSTYSTFQVHRATADTSMVAVNTVFTSMTSLYTSVNSTWNFTNAFMSTSDARGNTFVNFRSTSDTLFNTLISTIMQVRTDTSTLVSLLKTTSSELSDNTNTINGAANPVSWNSLKDVPSGFSDGTDDGSGAGTNSGIFVQNNAGYVNLTSMSFVTPYSTSILRLDTDVGKGTFTVLGATNPYRSISLPAASWMGVFPSSATRANSGFAINITTPSYNILGEIVHQFNSPNSTPSYAMTSFRMPMTWDGSTIGVQVAWQASTGQASTNCLWNLAAIATSSGTQIYTAMTSSVTITSTWVSTGTEILTYVSGGYQVLGAPVPGSRLKLAIWAAGGSFGGLPLLEDVMIWYREAVWDGKPR